MLKESMIYLKNNKTRNVYFIKNDHGIRNKFNSICRPTITNYIRFTLIIIEITRFPPYQISTFGYITRGSNTLHGYSNACLTDKHGISKGILTHRLIANAFIPNYES